MDFERLLVWQRVKALAVILYRQTASCPDLAFRSQITRSGLSVPSNIAEGMERFTAKDKCRFLYIAKASCGELRTQLMIGSEIGYIPEAVAAALITETRELSKMLCGLINKISE
ncbi:S23 ribosomal protein [Pseudomonas syringae KCTC 12500]|uniref:four helix bundle protein n=1 Tax=Pseudomonas syringae TaxID=317 RepID=UPI0004697202|nr:four helix bundle protein [Pseudomonas syringae]KMY00698.1 S23 ribosomal protein [Pseudomonas syringae KCTC 12500]POR86628.1 four helix bundle protein [Pseudomonas syringae pv. syringae]